MTTYPDNTDWVGKGWHAEPTAKELFASRTPPDMNFIDMGSGKAAWIPKNWSPKLTMNTTMTIHKDSAGIVFLYHDINGSVHALWTWKDGGTSFHWDLHPNSVTDYTIEYDGPVNPHLLKLAGSWLEYLDATVEKE
jgi:hypothetical protein